MCKILCSTGALLGRANNRDFRSLPSLAESLSCDGFEFLIYSPWYAEVRQLTEALASMGLNIPVVHFDKHIGEKISEGGAENMSEALRLLKINCQIAAAAGAKSAVLHLWSGLASDANIRNNIDAYDALARIAEGYGIDLMVENVVCNHADPLTHLCALAEKYPNIHFVYDTKMAAFHSQCDDMYRSEFRYLWERHIRHCHINDYKGAYKDWPNLRTLPIGSGNVDFEKFFSFIKEIPYTGMFTAESAALKADGTIDVEMLNNEFEYIRNH